LNLSKLDARMWMILPAAGLAVVAGTALYRWARRPRDPEDAERRRRARINQIGRIAEGRVLDIMEMPAVPEEIHGLARLARPRQDAASADRRKLVCYSYSISGVSYETAQDITSLSERTALDRLVAGQPASVKYDPVNPSNSIVVADDWSGVH
jgi:hypothetical protein